MILLPAIDLKDGKCVRLYQGDFDKVTVYGDPVEMAREWERRGARYLHVVDLDGAREGELHHAETIGAIGRALTIPFQVGGGVRTLERVETLLDLGATRVILGTQAAMDPRFLEEACGRFPKRIVLGIDVRDGKVAIRGWTDTVQVTPEELAARGRAAGAVAVVYTDIAKDGALAGPSLDATAAFARAAGLPVIVSGGVTSLEDIRAIKARHGEGIVGCIAGRALYTGDLDFAEALKVSEA